MKNRERRNEENLDQFLSKRVFRERNRRQKEIKVTSVLEDSSHGHRRDPGPLWAPFNGAGLVRSSSVGTKWHDDDDDATA